MQAFYFNIASVIADSLIKRRRGTFEREIRRNGGTVVGERKNKKYKKTGITQGRKFAPRRSELQLTVDFNDPSKQLRQIELPCVTDTPSAVCVRGERLFRVPTGVKGVAERNGCRWRLKTTSAAGRLAKFNCKNYFHCLLSLVFFVSLNVQADFKLFAHQNY